MAVACTLLGDVFLRWGGDPENGGHYFQTAIKGHGLPGCNNRPEARIAFDVRQLACGDRDVILSYSCSCL